MIAAVFALATGIGGAAMTISPETVSDALHFPPDDRIALGIRIAGVVVVLASAVGVYRALR